MPKSGAQGTPGNSLVSWLGEFLTYRPLLFKIIGRIVRPDDIEDIVQETFVHSYAAARKQKIHNPRAFMVTTARNIAFNHLKSADKKLKCSIEDVAEEELATPEHLVEDDCQSAERFLVFCRAVAQLPVQCRRVFILKKVYGLSQKEIADYLGISPSTVENHISKGMAMAVRYMYSKGHLEEDES
ncbi:MAG: sigma-70 family RNA polymerase sigma factor [Pseudomonadales bacterium]|jgi:RNA polymerase sigma-70 factor (ECF subfamily)|nr:sigma-70 family RNA polymerase sigma factor [Pseudomonadales bacterium]